MAAPKNSLRSLKTRRQRRHVWLAGSAVLSFSLLFYLLGFSPERWVDIDALKINIVTWRISVSLAYSALFFLAATLAVGPLALLRGRPNPTNDYLRRDLGYWAGGLALAHMAFAITIHTDGWRLWTLWLSEAGFSGIKIQGGWFGLANYAGLAMVALLSLLLVISNDAFMKRLGMRTWKNLQRLTYLVLALLFVHGFAYQRVEQRLPVMRAAFLLVIALIVIVQGLGVLAHLARRRKTGRHETARLKKSAAK